jgi:glyoxylase-like metal-dependent hydrolase (beta-lactamase superfamily II)
MDPTSMLTRRTALQLTAGTALAAMARPVFASTKGHHSLTLGQFQVTVISDGTVSLPLSFALPGRDGAEVDAIYKANGRTFDGLVGEVNVTVVKTPDAVIAIDAGGGTDFMPTMGRYAGNLEKAGIAPDSVTHVVFTHAHADHLWGIIDPFDGTTRFPKARHVMSAAERDYWLTPGIENQLPEAFKGMVIGTVRRLKDLGDRIESVKPGSEIVPGVLLVDTAGHTAGHMSVMLASGGERLLIGGDVLTNPVISFAKPDWTWGPDADPAKAAETRKRTLDMLATDKVRLLGYHLPWPGVGLIERKDGGYRLVTT